MKTFTDEDTKTIWYEFNYQGQRITVQPEDMKDEKTFRTRLLRYRVFWMTLPKSKKGPNPFELLMKGVVERSVEDSQHKFEDTLEEEKYNTLPQPAQQHLRLYKDNDYYTLKDINTKLYGDYGNDNDDKSEEIKKWITGEFSPDYYGCDYHTEFEEEETIKHYLPECVWLYIRT